MKSHPECRFIITVSSARKLRRGGVNLLAGRAVERHLFPFVYEEISNNFSLDDALVFGTLPPVFGRETHRKLQYTRSEASLYFWRTNHGAEVDLLIEKHGEIRAAIEIKSSPSVSGADLTGLKTFRQEHSTVPCFLISTVANAYELNGVKILPWKKYLMHLGELL